MNPPTKKGIIIIITIIIMSIIRVVLKLVPLKLKVFLVFSPSSRSSRPRGW
jgi:hypothetical protein